MGRHFHLLDFCKYPCSFAGVKLKAFLPEHLAHLLLIQMSTSSLPTYGDFAGLNLPTWDREMIQSGFEAVSSVEGGWEFLRTYQPPADKGFMFSPPTGKRVEIEEAISTRYPGHSGASYGSTMRVLEFIAKNGWNTYAREVLHQYALPPNPLQTVVQQVTTVDRFIGSLPTDSSLLDFANAIQTDPAMRAQIPDIDTQSEALKKFAEGKMTYAEMRSLCG